MGKLRSSLDTVARQNQLLRRAATIEDRLTKLVLDGGDIREIASAVAQLTAKPCAVYDATLRTAGAGDAAGPRGDRSSRRSSSPRSATCPR